MIKMTSEDLRGKLVYVIQIIPTRYISSNCSIQSKFHPNEGIVEFAWEPSTDFKIIGSITKIIIDNIDNLKKIKNDPMRMFQKLTDRFRKTKRLYTFSEAGICRKVSIVPVVSIHLDCAYDKFTFFNKKKRDEVLELCRTLGDILKHNERGACSGMLIKRYFK